MLEWIYMQAEKADAERCAAGLAEQLERAQRAAAEAALEADAARAAIVAKAAAEQARLLHLLCRMQAGTSSWVARLHTTGGSASKKSSAPPRHP